MDPFLLRKMETRKDAAGAARVRSLAWQESYSPLLEDRVIARRTPEYCLPGMMRVLTSPEVEAAVAEDEYGEIVGFVVYGPCRDDDVKCGSDEPVGEIQALYTLEKTYGSGLGHALIAWGLVELERMGLGRVVAVWLLEGNGRAQAFYHKEGFAADGAVKELPTLGEGVAEFRMMRNI